MEFEISYTNKEITPWGGMVFLKQMLEKMGFRELIEQNRNLPRPGSNRGYQTSTIIESFITSIWCGASRFLHTEVMRRWGKYLVGKRHPDKMFTNDFSVSLHTPKTFV